MHLSVDTKKNKRFLCSLPVSLYELPFLLLFTHDYTYIYIYMCVDKNICITTAKILKNRRNLDEKNTVPQKRNLY